jgi:SAM-dependent methyltransferase
LGALAALSYLVPYQRRYNRRAEIKEILADLKSLESHPEYKEATKQNTEFFRAIRNPFSYAWWLIFRAPKLRKNRARIVELLDMPFSKWQKAVLETLSWFEVWMHVLEPIKNQIIQELEALRQDKKEPIAMASIGCGGMELERQIIYQLVRKRFNFPLIFIGIDYAPASFEVAKAKFKNLEDKGLLQVKTVSHLGVEELNDLKAEAASHRFTVVLLKANAFDLEKLPANSLDLVYHTRLRHHLTTAEGQKLDKLTAHLAPKLVELDDLFTIRGILITSIFAWRFPAVLSGAIFSFLRDSSQEELRSQPKQGCKLGLHGKTFSCYLRVCSKAG